MEAIIRTEVGRKRVMDFIAGLRLEHPWAVKVVRHQRKRTLSQNALLHMWLQEIARKTGNTMADIKDAYREMFLGRVAIRLGETEHLIGRSTTRLTKQEFGDFLDQVHAHATQELGIMLPLPEESHYDRDGSAIQNLVGAEESGGEW